MTKRIHSMLLGCSVLLIQACALTPQSQLAPVGGFAGGEVGIFYNGSLRRITIIGESGFANNAVVHLNPAIAGPGMAQSVVVRLTTGDAVTPQFDKSFPLTTAFEATPLPSNPNNPPDSFIPVIVKHVEEIVFEGGSENDRFENKTHIPAEAKGYAGDDTLISGSGDDYLYGGSGSDELKGGGGDDHLYGNQGSDQLFGGDGDDILKDVGASGNDADLNMLCGGRGADILIGDALSNGQLDGELGGGNDDGDADTLKGFSSPGHFWDYEFNVPPDILWENGEVLVPGTQGFPQSVLIACG